MLHGYKEHEIIHFPIQINKLTNIKMISCSYYYTVCLNNEGRVFSFGFNDKGQLGIGRNFKQIKQTHIPKLINIPLIKYISCGSNFTICLTDDNKLYSFGQSNYGQLGLGNRNNYNSPQQIPNLNNIELIECGGFHVICKTYDNEFYSWGSNLKGQLGHGNKKSLCNKPYQPKNWPDNIIKFKCGAYNLLLLSEGKVYSFGNNDNGQLGINDKTIFLINTPTLIKDIPEIQRIEYGDNHAILVDINSNIWLFGYNYQGQLGLGDKEKRFKPIIHPTLSNIIDISSGGNHTFVKTFDNKIYAFGDNTYSQLGIKTSEIYQLTPIQVFEGKEDIWNTTLGKSRQKSARK